MSKLLESMFEWLKTFKLSGPHRTPEDLCDGVCLAHVLNQISPEHFDGDWLTKVKTNASHDNWRLRVSNVKKILEAIEQFHDIIGSPISPSFPRPDCNLIGKELDSKQLGRLLQLILGCAVNCDQKEMYIENIMGLELEVQLNVKQAIEELLVTRDRDNSGSMSMIGDSINLDQMVALRDSLKKTNDDLSAANEAKDKAIQTLFDLQREFVSVAQEKDMLRSENDRLSSKVRVLEESSSKEQHDPSDASLKDRHVSKLQVRIEQLQDDLFKLESIKDEYRIKTELLEKEMMEIKLRNEELQRKANEARRLKDDLDIMREASEKAEKQEQTIEMYKKKLEEMADHKRSSKMLEDKNNSLLKKTMELEDEIRRFSTMKAQVDQYKKQVQDLKNQLVEQTHRAEKFEFEHNVLSGKLSNMNEEKDVLLREHSEMRSKAADIRNRSSSNYAEELFTTSGQLKNTSNGQLNLSSEMTDDFTAPEIKEKIVRLETENFILNKRLEESEALAVSQVNYENAQRRVLELETESRLQSQRILELQARLAGGGGAQAEEMASFKSSIRDYEIKLASLEAVIAKKDEDMAEMETRHKKYLAKAKEVAKVMEPLSLQLSANNSLVNSDDLSQTSLRFGQLLNQKDKQIAEMEVETDKTKALIEMEQRLITVAVHSLASNLQRRAAEERITGRPSSSFSGQPASGSGSFLSRQRQATARRFNHAGVSQNDFFEQ
ncbi:Protein Hook -like protein [Halotydeus destructor]|nr:Protein Hook -like protein [Halotydeus destructor]